MPRDAVGERRQLRRGALRLADDAGRRGRAFGLHHIEGEVGDLLAAARQHHPHGVDEGDARAPDDLGRDIFEVEAGDVFGDELRELFAAGQRLGRSCCRRRLGERARRTEHGGRAGAEKQAAVDGDFSCRVTVLHIGVLLDQAARGKAQPHLCRPRESGTHIPEAGTHGTIGPRFRAAFAGTTMECELIIRRGWPRQARP